MNAVFLFYVLLKGIFTPLKTGITQTKLFEINVRKYD